MARSKNDQLNWKVAGPAGKGIMTTGLIFSKTCAAHGWEIFDYAEYPSLITGGHNAYQVLASQDQAVSQQQRLDLLVALDESTLDLHLAELDDDSLVILDAKNLKSTYSGSGQAIDVPLQDLALEKTQDKLMANNVALGASAALLGLDLKLLKKIIKHVFDKKGAKVVQLNQLAAESGFEYVQKTYPQFQASPIKKNSQQLLTMTGNEAISLGAIAGGLQFFVAYPMTPASSILHILAAKAKQADIVVKHAEDEISVINMALGASFAGVRAMTATSGGGFCYMTEAIGLSGVAELPMVIIESMRPGPALGMPTWTAQGDLQMVISAGQDEFPRIILASGDATEAFEQTRLAFQLAEKYQLPVILLSDKYLSESRFSLKLESEKFTNQRFGFTDKPQADENGFFPRYKIAKNGVSKRSIPGQKNGTHLTNSYEHDQYGIGIESGEIRQQQLEKRFSKQQQIIEEIPPQFMSQQPNSKLVLVGFGSSKGSLIAAAQILKEQNIPVDVCNLSWLWPFPVKQLEKLIKKGQEIVVVEGNSQGQLATLITAQTGYKIKHFLRKYDGRPFYPTEIAAGVKKIIKKLGK
jgi:2-oxoglutarate/2-oxoacid ferredoxin oxidoreductase subunit alpha